MTSPSQLSAWADRILDSLDETGISSASVVTWMQNNLYQLNLALSTGFITNSSGYIDPGLNQSESGIYEQMYFCHYFGKKGNSTLGAFALDWTEIRSEEGDVIRRVSKNEVSKNYFGQQKECKIQLKELIEWYQSENLVMAGQILLGDRGNIADGDQMTHHQPPTDIYTSHSTVWRG